MNNECLALQGQSINGAPRQMTLPGLGAPYDLDRAITDLVQREFSVEARIARAVKCHQARKHLTRHHRLIKVLELAA